MRYVPRSVGDLHSVLNRRLPDQMPVEAFEETGILAKSVGELRRLGCDHASPYMLYTHRVRTDALAAVTHVNGTARIQTVSVATNRKLYDLLSVFKARTGYGVLCNTSLNFKGRGFINKIDDLSTYVVEHKLDGFVVEEKAYLLKSSTSYQAYLKMPNSIAAERSSIHA
jgi:predicted NodU family carbamoyl transferase